MTASVLSVRVDSDIKASFSSLCDELGLSPSAAVNVFMRQMLRERSFPFVPSAAKTAKTASSDILSRAFIETEVRKIAAEREEIESITLFGSYARGDATAGSDVDLRLVVCEDARMGAFALASLSEELRESLGRPVDLVTAEHLNDELQSAVDREGVLIYERAQK